MVKTYERYGTGHVLKGFLIIQKKKKKQKRHLYNLRVFVLFQDNTTFIIIIFSHITLLLLPN